MDPGSIYWVTDAGRRFCCVFPPWDVEEGRERVQQEQPCAHIQLSVTGVTGVTRFISLRVCASQMLAFFYKLKARPSTSTKIPILFIAILA